MKIAFPKLFSTGILSLRMLIAFWEKKTKVLRGQMIWGTLYIKEASYITLMDIYILNFFKVLWLRKFFQ